MTTCQSGDLKIKHGSGAGGGQRVVLRSRYGVLFPSQAGVYRQDPRNQRVYFDMQSPRANEF